MRGAGWATVAAALALAGCHQAARVGGALAAASPEQAKINAYTEGYNVVLGDFGLAEEYQSYLKAGIGGPQPQPEYAYMTGGWLNQAQDKLHAGRAIAASGLGDVDAAADAFIPALDKVMAHEASLKSYYASKAYKDDGLARGRREDPVLVGEFKTAMAAGDRFDAVLTKAREAREQAELRQLKAAGDTLAYDMRLSLMQSRALTQTFHSQADLADPAKRAAAEARAQALQATLTDLHAQVAKVKGRAQGADQWRVDSFDRAASSLDTLLGAYRDLKGGGGASAYNAMIQAYNSAISSVNATLATGAL